MGSCGSVDKKKTVLIAATSNDKLGATDKKTGAWLEEIAAPFNAFKKAGFNVVIATPAGTKPPIDEGSKAGDFMTEDCKAFEADADATKAMDATIKIADAKVADFDAIFVPGGHGVCWDLATDKDLGALLEAFNVAKKVISSVCHGPVCLGAPGADSVLKNRTAVTGFSNDEEKMAGLNEVVPASLEDMLNDKSGGKYTKAAEPWAPHVCVSDNLVTGQNPGSSAGVAAAVVQILAPKVEEKKTEDKKEDKKEEKKEDAPAEEKPATPAAEEKAAAPAEKAATPAAEEKAAAPAEEKAATPAAEEAAAAPATE